jgi:mannose/fructose/N-acetylgalactosamine-specific phosphotransferase system component IIC
VVVIGSGVALAVWACLHDFDQAFETWRMSRAAYFGARASQIFGDITRGVLIVLIGIYILVGAVTDDPNHAKSLGEVLKTIARQAYGGWLLGIGALGLLAFGVSSIFEALYRRV